MYVTEVLRDLTCQLQALVRAVSHEHHLSPTQAQVLFSIPQDGIPMSSLAHRLGLDASTISRIIHKMVQQGWVARHTAAEDRRVIRVLTTEDGQRIYRQLINDMDDKVQAILVGLDADRHENLSQTLEELSWRMRMHRT